MSDTERAPLLGSKEVDEEQLTGCGAPLLCNPNLWLHRFVILFFMCFLSFGKSPYRFLSCTSPYVLVSALGVYSFLLSKLPFNLSLYWFWWLVDTDVLPTFLLSFHFLFLEFAVFSFSWKTSFYHCICFVVLLSELNNYVYIRFRPYISDSDLAYYFWQFCFV